MHSVSATVCEGGGRVGSRSDQFPAGMSVLAVDDDPTCLRVLEALLLRCRYHVTTTDQATVALQLLRENRNKFDLVISDVHMPDMDGFKLLELVGLEMDLPVIMLSVNGETKTVMKGITHGACDYLLKPVRIEELKNIWQHVVRRRKLSCKDYSRFDMVESEKHQSFSSDGGQSLHFNGLSDHNGKLTGKRKEQNEEDDYEENMHESEDSTAQKKPRVVWSIDLHQKFVVAVNQLGIEKAVPKRILDLMNVDKLTRENVASHLQKYRLYLKRLSAVASQQASIVAAFGTWDPSYLHGSSLDGFGALTASGQLPAFPSLQPSEMIVKANTSDLGVQFGQNNTGIPTNDLNRLQKFKISSNQSEKLLQGIPTSLELKQLKLKGFQEANSHFPGGFPNTSSPRSTHHQKMYSKGLVNLSSVRSMPIPLDPFIVEARIPSNLPDLGKCKDIRRCPGYTTNTLSIGPLSNNDDIPKLTDSFPLPLRDRSHQRIYSISTVASSPQDPFIGREGHSSQCSSPSSRTTVLLPTAMVGETNLLNFSNAGYSNHGLGFCKDHIVERNALFNSFPSSSLSTNFVTSPVPVNQRTKSSHCNNRRIAEGVISFQNTSSILPLQKDNCNLETMKLQEGRVLSSCSLNDLVSSFIKPEKDDIYFMDSDIGSDLYSLGA